MTTRGRQKSPCNFAPHGFSKKPIAQKEGPGNFCIEWNFHKSQTLSYTAKKYWVIKLLMLIFALNWCNSIYVRHRVKLTPDPVRKF